MSHASPFTTTDANSAAEPKRSAGIFAERPADGLLQRGRHRLPQAGQSRHGLVQLSGKHRLDRGPAERRVAGKHFIQHAAQGIRVTASIDIVLTHRLLGTHVHRRAHRQPALRQSRIRGDADRGRHAEVGDDGVPPMNRMFSGLMSRWTMPRLWA